MDVIDGGFSPEDEWFSKRVSPGLRGWPDHVGALKRARLGSPVSSASSLTSTDERLALSPRARERNRFSLSHDHTPRARERNRSTLSNDHSLSPGARDRSDSFSLSPDDLEHTPYEQCGGEFIPFPAMRARGNAHTHEHDEVLQEALRRIRSRQHEVTPAEDGRSKELECVDVWRGDEFGASWLQVAEQLCTTLQRRHNMDAHSKQLVSRLAFSVDPMRGTYRNTGDERLERINRDLDLFGAKRTQVQKIMHYWFIQAALEKIYGTEWDSSATRALQRYGLKAPCTEVMAITPRRFGKTWSVAMFVVAMLLNVPGLRICIFSTGKRASSSLKAIAKRFVRMIPGAEGRICKETNEEMYIGLEPLPPGRGLASTEAKNMQTLPTTSTLHSFPCSPKGQMCVCCVVRVVAAQIRRSSNRGELVMFHRPRCRWVCSSPHVRWVGASLPVSLVMFHRPRCRWVCSSPHVRWVGASLPVSLVMFHRPRCRWVCLGCVRVARRRP